jgi:quercetin dioxygenase-like cupin family protein
MSDVDLYDLDARWDESVGDPLTLFEQNDPPAQAGSYVIQPGERVPKEGWTSHEGTELSVILSGEVRLVTPATERIVSENSFSVIPAGVDHYSINETDEPVRLVYTVVGEL